MEQTGMRLIMASFVLLTGCTSVMVDPGDKRELLRAIEGNHDYLTNQYKNLMDVFTFALEFPVVGAAVTVGKYDFGLLMGGYPTIEGKGGVGWGGGFEPDVYGFGLRGGELGYYKAEQTVLFSSQQAEFAFRWPESSERMARARNKEWREERLPAYAGYRLGFSIGLGVGAKVEVNFGEIADFLAGVVGFDLFQNRIFSVPPDLDLRGLNLDAWPKGLSQQRHVEVLHIGKNRIDQIPGDIGEMSALEVLDLSDNRLKELPREVARLRRLRRLALDGNPIKKLPAELANLEALSELVIPSDPIPELPPEFAKFKRLALTLLPRRPITEEDKRVIRKAFPDMNLD